MSAKFTREAILNSQLFKKYQPDFLAVILTKNEYTIAEATRIAEAFFKNETGGDK